jgi:RNAse (barnase) inhibitor barstar
MKIERYIRDNRDAFDDKEPSDALWDKISGQLTSSVMPVETTKTISKSKIVHADFQNGGYFKRFEGLNWRLAASILVFLGLGCVLYNINQKYQVTAQPEIVLSNPSMAKQVGQYTTLVENKRLELQELTQNNLDLYNQFAQELDILEKSYQNLKADLPKNQNQETLIYAMIQNLQLQIDVLNQQLQIIEKMKESKNENHENNKSIII